MSAGDPIESLIEATSGSARRLGLQDAVGRIAVGYRADLVLVRGRPDQNLVELAKVSRVFVDGIEQSPSEPGVFALMAVYWNLGLAWVGQ